MNNKLKSAELIPGSYGLPIIGELIDFLVKREEFYWQKHQDNGNIFKTSSLIFGKTVCLVGPEANRLVFKDAADRLSSRLGNKLLATISPDSVLLKDGEAHRTNRRLILPVFHQQAIAFLFAGHDTTSTLMSWLLFELGNCPQWRQRLRDEQQQVMGNEPISMTHLRQLPHMTNVIKEGERLYPPAFLIARVALEDIEYAGYLIPAGWFVFISPMLTHRLPEIYQNPDAFDPDRFAPPREEDKKQPYSLIGFGGGAHTCIGVELAQMEMKIILSTLLQKYDWTVTLTTAEIAPVRRPFTMQKQLKATFVSID